MDERFEVQDRLRGGNVYGDLKSDKRDLSQYFICMLKISNPSNVSILLHRRLLAVRVKDI